MKPNRLWAVCLAALVVLAGCVGLPRSGRVNSVSPSKTSSGAIGFAVQPPARNATPQQIVEGFLLASRAGLDDDFAVARQYLYGDAAANWKPLARVRVYPDSQDVSTTVTESGAVRASVASRGTLSSHGTYTETANSAVLTTEFSLAKNADGQWRIVSLDDGVFLSENAFSQQFIETPLYFLAPDSNALVADLRYYPRRTFATSAMNGLLAGPSEWLASGVHTAVPTGTKLLKSVDVVDGEATVDLSSVVLAASAKERAALLEQITRTLKASSSVRSVVLKVEGADLNVGSIQSLPTYPYGSYPVSVISGGLPANVSDNRITPLMGDAGLKAHGLSNLAISYQASRGRLAALGRGGTELIGMDSGSGSWQVLHSGKSLVQPSYDRYGWVWSAERDNAGKILVFKPGENASAHLAERGEDPRRLGLARRLAHGGGLRDRRGGDHPGGGDRQRRRGASDADRRLHHHRPASVRRHRGGVDRPQHRRGSGEDGPGGRARHVLGEDLGADRATGGALRGDGVHHRRTRRGLDRRSDGQEDRLRA